MVKPKTAKLRDYFSAQLYVLSKEEGGGVRPLKKSVMGLFSKCWDCSGRIELVGDKEFIMPGEDGT